jgi:hypothetical protein
MRSRGAAKVVARSSMMAAKVASAGVSFDHLDGDGVRLEHALGHEQDPSALRFAVDEAHAARQALRE